MLSQGASAKPSSSCTTIQVALEPLPDMDQLAVTWASLEGRADHEFFLSWTWISTWLATITRRPELLIARISGRVVGLGFVMSQLMVRHRVMPIWTVLLNQTGNPTEDIITIEYNDILADRLIAKEVRLACLRFLMTKRRIGGRRVGEVVLGGLEETRAEDILKLGRPVRELASVGSARVDLAAIRRSGKPYEASLRPSVAKRLRRSMDLYQRQGEIELSIANSIEQAVQFLDMAGGFHQQRWVEKGHPGAFAYPFYLEFHRRLIGVAFPLGQLELAKVEVGGEPIGFLYNFIYRKHVYYYFSGFRFDTDNRLKPGLVCHKLCIERHLANGMDVYDFMGGEQRYKVELGKPGPRITSVAVQCSNFMLAAERPLRRLKQALKDRQSA